MTSLHVCEVQLGTLSALIQLFACAISGYPNRIGATDITDISQCVLIWFCVYMCSSCVPEQCALASCA